MCTEPNYTTHLMNLYTPSNCVMTNKALNFPMFFYLCSSFKTSDDPSDSQLQYLPNFTLKSGCFVESIDPMMLNSLEHKPKPLHAKLCLNFWQIVCNYATYNQHDQPSRCIFVWLQKCDENQWNGHLFRDDYGQHQKIWYWGFWFWMKEWRLKGSLSNLVIALSWMSHCIIAPWNKWKSQVWLLM